LSEGDAIQNDSTSNTVIVNQP